jgi:hypothetical protein
MVINLQRRWINSMNEMMAMLGSALGVLVIVALTAIAIMDAGMDDDDK